MTPQERAEKIVETLKAIKFIIQSDWKWVKEQIAQRIGEMEP